METFRCHSYNASCGPACDRIVECPGDVKRRQCFVFWKQEDSQEPVVALKVVIIVETETLSSNGFLSSIVSLQILSFPLLSGLFF